jgi:hypothetical protein
MESTNRIIAAYVIHIIRLFGALPSINCECAYMCDDHIIAGRVSNGGPPTVGGVSPSPSLLSPMPSMTLIETPLPRLPPGGSVSYDEFQIIIAGIEAERKQRRELQEIVDKTKSVIKHHTTLCASYNDMFISDMTHFP